MGEGRRSGGLARFDDPGWTTFTEADGRHGWDVQGSLRTDLLDVAADGSLWLPGARPVRGLRRR